MRNQMVTHAGPGRHCASRAAEAAFQALADPTRRALLELLRRGSRPAGEMASAFPVSRPAISRHLRVLRQAHLVRESRSGRHRYYALNPKPLRALDKWLDDYRALWSGKLAALKAFVEADEAASRTGNTQTKAARARRAKP